MWMKHAVTGGIADLPDLPYWRAQGWEPADGPPPEPDLLRDPPAATPEDPETPSETGSSAAADEELVDGGGHEHVHD